MTIKLVTSKPKHGDPLFIIRDKKAYASQTFQRYLDDLQSATNKIIEKINDEHP